MESEGQKSPNEENVSINLGNLLKNAVTEFCDETTVQGLPHIQKSSNHIALRIFWALCTLASAIYCIISCKNIFDNYYSRPTSTKISLVNEIPSQFPKVTFCNIKSLDCSKNETLNFINQNGIFSEFDTRVAMGNSNFTYSEKHQLGFSIDDMLYECIYNNKKCSSYYFSYFYSETYGNCYSFNSGYYANGSNQTILTSRSNGVKNGLQLAIYLGDPSVDIYHTYSAGVVVSIDNQSIVPFTKGDEIKVAARTNTDLIVDRTFTYKQPAPYGDCLADTSKSSSFSSLYYDYIVRIQGQNYSQQYCSALCLQNQYKKNCNCSAYDLPVFINSSVLYCDSDNYVACGEKITDLTECTTACPFECFSIDYNVKSHFVLYPNSYEAKGLLDWAVNNSQSLTPTEVAEAYLYLNVYYHSIQYTLSEENILIQPADVMANFGGIFDIFSIKLHFTFI